MRRRLWTRRRVRLSGLTRHLLQQTIGDSNLLIEHEAGDGWPYWLRASAAIAAADTFGPEETSSFSAASSSWS